MNDEDPETRPDVPEHEREQELLWAYERAKRNYRKYVGKPNRKVRRFVRRHKGKGKGKGKRLSGKGVRLFLASLSEEEDTAFFGGARRKGQGKRKGKSRGKGRRGNPIGKDGQQMKCWVEKPASKGGGKCGSTQHLSRDCPYNVRGASSSSTLWGEADHSYHTNIYPRSQRRLDDRGNIHDRHARRRRSGLGRTPRPH